MTLHVDKAPISVYSHSWPEIATPDSSCKNLSDTCHFCSKWLRKWRVCINIDKTVAIFFTRRWHRRVPQTFSSLIKESEVFGITFHWKHPWNAGRNNTADKILSRVTVTKTRVCIGDWIYWIQVVTTNNYNTVADLHNLQSLHTNLISLSALVLTDL
jgi:hypothetical protein